MPFFSVILQLFFFSFFLPLGCCHVSPHVNKSTTRRYEAFMCKKTAAEEVF